MASRNNCEIFINVVVINFQGYIIKIFDKI